MPFAGAFVEFGVPLSGAFTSGGGGGGKPFIEPSDGTTGNNVYFYGDSITLGQDASTTAKRWTTLLSVAKGWVEFNNGHAGWSLCTSAQGNACTSFLDITSIPTKTAADRWIFIAAGNNDVQLTADIQPADYKQRCIDWVNAAVAKGWDPSRIVLISVFYASFTTGSYTACFSVPITVQRREDFITAVVEAAAETGARSIDEYHPMEAAGGNSLIDPIGGGPGIHPNDTGHQFIADDEGAYFS